MPRQRHRRSTRGSHPSPPPSGNQKPPGLFTPGVFFVSAEREGWSSGPFGILARLGDYPLGHFPAHGPLGSNPGFSSLAPTFRKSKTPRALYPGGLLRLNGARGIELRSLRDPRSSRGLPNRNNLTMVAPRLEPGGSHPSPPPSGNQKPPGLSTPGVFFVSTEREGFEPPSPFGRSLSRRVQYHSASAPESADSDSVGLRMSERKDRCQKNWSLGSNLRFKPGENLRGRMRGRPIGAPGFEPGTSASRTQRSTGLSHAPNKKSAHPAAQEKSGRGGIRTHEAVFAAHTLSRRAP